MLSQDNKISDEFTGTIMLLSINSQHALLRSGMSNSVAMHRKPVTIDENFTTV
jgi:hypothetical protein